MNSRHFGDGGRCVAERSPRPRVFNLRRALLQAYVPETFFPLSNFASAWTRFRSFAALQMTPRDEFEK